MSTNVFSPVAGLAAPLGEVPDPVFSQAMVGPGVAIKPGAGRAPAVAPVSGTLSTLHPHAFVVSTDEGAAILVHLGIDTVKLQGEGFDLHVAKGDRVTVGEPIATWDPSMVEQRGYSSVCPVVALEVGGEALADLVDDGDIAAGDQLFVVEA